MLPDGNALSAAGIMGVIAQAWRASSLPNVWMYPLLLGSAALVAFALGGDVTWRPFAAHTLALWLVSLGVNRVASDVARGGPFETKH